MVELDYSPVRHRVDVHVQSCQVLTTHLAAAPLNVAFTLPIGIIRNVKIIFHRGCNRHISMYIMHHGIQWMPVVLGSVFCEDTGGMPLEFDVYRDVWDGQQDFQIIAWNDGVDVYWNHVVTVLFGYSLSEVL